LIGPFKSFEWLLDKIHSARGSFNAVNDPVQIFRTSVDLALPRPTPFRVVAHEDLRFGVGHPAGPSVGSVEHYWR